MKIQMLTGMLTSFLKGLELKETTVPIAEISGEMANLQQRLANGGLELRRIVETNSGFIGYVVLKKGEPALLPRAQK